MRGLLAQNSGPGILGGLHKFGRSMATPDALLNLGAGLASGTNSGLVQGMFGAAASAAQQREAAAQQNKMRSAMDLANLSPAQRALVEAMPAQQRASAVAGMMGPVGPQYHNVGGALAVIEPGQEPRFISPPKQPAPRSGFTLNGPGGQTRYGPDGEFIAGADPTAQPAASAATHPRFQHAMATRAATQVDALGEDLQGLENQREIIKTALGALDRGAVIGPGADARKLAGALTMGVGAFGLPTREDLAQSRIFDQAARTLTMEQLANFKGAISDSERRFAAKIDVDINQGRASNERALRHRLKMIDRLEAYKSARQNYILTRGNAVGFPEFFASEVRPTLPPLEASSGDDDSGDAPAGFTEAL